MLRSLAQTRAKVVGDICRQNAGRLLSTQGGAAPESAASSSSGIRKFFYALVPIGVIAVAAERAHKGSEQQQPGAAAGPSQPVAAAAPLPAVAAGAVAGAAPSGQQGGSEQASPAKVTIQGGVTSHGVEIDPANPLHKLLPETDCEFCLETREKLWGMVKSMKHDAKAGGKPAANKAASSSSSSAPDGADASAPAPAAASAVPES